MKYIETEKRIYGFGINGYLHPVVIIDGNPNIFTRITIPFKVGDGKVIPPFEDSKGVVLSPEELKEKVLACEQKNILTLPQDISSNHIEFIEYGGLYAVFSQYGVALVNFTIFDTDLKKKTSENLIKSLISDIHIMEKENTPVPASMMLSANSVIFTIPTVFYKKK